MTTNLSLQNCLQFRNLGKFYSVASLEKQTLQFIIDNFENLSKEKQLYEFEFGEMKDLFSSDNLNVCMIALSSL